MGKGILSALAATAVAGLILGGFFVSWRKTANDRVAANPILSLDEMETQGIPRFEARTIEGREFKLDELAGKVVLVNFWASWCAPCIDEFPSMLKLVQEFPNDMVLVAVSRDRTQEDIDSFLKSFPGIRRPNILIVWDKDGAIGRSYNIDRLPESFLAYPGLKLARKIIGTIPWHTPDSVEFIKSMIARPAVEAGK